MSISKKRAESLRSKVSSSRLMSGGGEVSSKQVSVADVRSGSRFSSETLTTERNRLYQLRYRLKKKLRKKGLSKKERSAASNLLRRSTRSLNSLKSSQRVYKQPSQPSNRLVNSVRTYYIKTWEAHDVVDDLLNSGLYKSAFIDGKRYTMFSKNSMRVLAAVQELEIKADSIDAYYLRVQSDLVKNRFYLDLEV